jgi:hypothetical protein
MLKSVLKLALCEDHTKSSEYIKILTTGIILSNSGVYNFATKSPL